MAVRRKFSLAMFGFVFGLGGKSISDKVLGGKELIMWIHREKYSKKTSVLISITEIFFNSFIHSRIFFNLCLSRSRKDN